MFFFLSKLLDIFLSPFTWSLLLLAAAVPWRARDRSPRRARRRRACGVAGLAVMLLTAMPPVGNALLWNLEHSSTSTCDDAVTYDAVILLGGVVEERAMKASGQIAFNDSVERLIVTDRLLREGKARVAIVSGLSPEADALARQIEDWGIPKERVIVEPRARNTRENALFAQEIARARGFDRVLVVTSAFHMPRAAECFAAVGMKVDTLSVDYRAIPSVPFGEWLPRASGLAMSTMVFREVAGRFIYRLQGYGKPAA
ncbi:MAG: YdcF family protein [Polyangiales bacterium]